MRRARKQRTYALLSLHFNIGTQLYEISAAGVLYQMPLESTRSLKEYFKQPDATLEAWYLGLTKEERRVVLRTGNIRASDSDFFPDPQYD